jgi:MOSC domain-containing protein YiiM
MWRAGPALTLQVTQARQPCYKLARRLRQPHIVKMVRENSWGGWYLRVLVPGPAEAGMPIHLVQRLHPQWTVAHAVQVMYNRRIDRAPAQQLAALPELSARWTHELLM